MKQTLQPLEELSDIWLSDMPPSLEEHMARLQSAQRNNLMWMGLEIAVVIAATVFGLWLLSQQQILIGLATLVFSAFGLVISVFTRRRLAKALTAPVVDNFASNLSEQKARYRVAIGGVLVSLAAMLFVGVVAYASDGNPTFDAVALICTTIALVWSIWKARCVKRECRRLDAMQQDLDQ